MPRKKKTNTFNSDNIIQQEFQTTEKANNKHSDNNDDLSKTQQFIIMNQKKNNINDNDFIIQVNKTDGFTQLEKTAITQYRNNEVEENLSKTQQFKIINQKKKSINDDDLITQINKTDDFTPLEKTAIMQYRVNKAEEDLSKTQQFKIMNQKKKDDDIELPKKKVSLGDTIRLKLSDLRAAIDLPQEKKKKSLYDTIIIKLDDIINKRSSLDINTKEKVVSSRHLSTKKKFHLFGPKDITKSKNIHINVDSEEFERQIYNLNKIALINLSKSKNSSRKYSYASKLNKMENIHISKQNYLKYQRKLTKFAINKLYYKFAPKESKKYKLYKYSVFTSGFICIVTSLIIINWFIQGISTNSVSNAMQNKTNINIIDDGVLYNADSLEGINVDSSDTMDDYKKKTSLYWKYLETPLSSVDLDALKKENNDTIGWLIVNNTNVNYPVVQTIDNDYYLHHSFNKKKNSAGWVFADFRDDFNTLSKNTVVYAHGRKDKVMFGSLTNTLKKNWYTNIDNQIIQLSTLKYNTMWQIFSIYKIEAESYYITTDFYSDDSFEEFITTMKKRSIYDFNINVTKDDKLLTLSTCYNDNGIRLVVQAKLVKIQER